MAFALSGCAKSPPGGVVSPGAIDTMKVRMALDNPVDDRYYYYVAFDDDGDGSDGPLPLRQPGGNGWGTGSFTTFVQYHAGQYQVYSHVVNPDESVTDTPIDRPFGYTLPGGSNTLEFTLDMGKYFAPGVEFLDVNFITTNELLTDPNLNIDKTYDGLGPTGNTYITFRITTNATYENQTYPSDRELAGDVYLSPIDIIDWLIDIEKQ